MSDPAASTAPVSIVIITRDSARTLDRCLASTTGQADVLVFDNGSSDDTLDIVRRHGHVRLAEGPFVDFSDVRNRAAALAAHDWICPLDADEWLSEELATALRDFQPESPATVHAFWRLNWFAGQRLRSRLGREWIRRVYHRRQVRFAGAVHEHLECLDGQRPAVAALPGAVHHDPYADVGHLFHKRWFYARPALRGRKQGGPWVASLRGLWRFLRAYLLQYGFVDGWRGFALASADAYGTFLKYLWAYAEQRRPDGGGPSG